jgi:rubredoxin
MSSQTTAEKRACTPCGYTYDPLQGDPDAGVAPGTSFDDLPDTWFCPVCGAEREQFVPLTD